MCGRYACTMQPLGRWKAVFKVWIEGLEDTYNIAPTATIPVFTAEGWRWMRWGLVPSWSKEPVTKYATFNARAESLVSKPAYRSAWKHGRRCLVPATGYYEWRAGEAAKVPYFIRSVADEPLVLAGLWDHWEHGGHELLSCALVTCEARGELRGIHERVPLMVDPAAADIWLHGSSDACREILASPTAVEVEFYPVRKAVGSVRNQGAWLIEPVVEG